MNRYYQSGALYCAISENKREYFYEDGTLKTVEEYGEGRLHGKAVLYWENGKVKRTCSFVNGVRDGLDQMWSEQGVLVDAGCYRMGKPILKHHRFNFRGSLIEEIEYLDGCRFNLTQWDDEGKLRTEALWIDSDTYREKAWDRFQNIWIEKEGYWNGKRLVYV